MAENGLMSPDRFTRTALVAVELVDPVTLTVVYTGVQVSALGLSGGPVLSWSGRFVWLAEGDAWPASFAVDPGGLPYESETRPSPPRPADLQAAPAAERLARIVLRPSPAYPFEAGVTSVRGRLRETADPDAAPVAGAEVWIRWANDAPAGPPLVDAPVRALTNAAGEFAAFLRLPAGARPKVENGSLVVRLAVSRGGVTRETTEERLPDGRGRDLSGALAWSDMA